MSDTLTFYDRLLNAKIIKFFGDSYAFADRRPLGHHDEHSIFATYNFDAKKYLHNAENAKEMVGTVYQKIAKNLILRYEARFEVCEYDE